MINRIIFYSNKGETPYKEESYIEYINGTSEILSKQEGISRLNQFIKEQKKTYEELKNNEKVLFVHKSKLKESIDDRKINTKINNEVSSNEISPDKLSNEINITLQEYNTLKKKNNYFEPDEINELDILANKLLESTKLSKRKKILKEFKSRLEEIDKDITLDNDIEKAIIMHEELKKHSDILSEKDYKELEKLFNKLNKANEKGTYTNALEKYNMYINKIQELNELLNNDFEVNNSKRDKNIKKKIRKTILFILLSFGVGATVGKTVKSILNDSKIEKKLNDNEDKEKYIYDLYNLIKDKSINEDRRNFIKKNWEYLIDYNSTSSHLLISNGSKTRISHTFEEIMIDQLIFNNYSDIELQEIFGSYKIDIDKLIKVYKKGVIQDTMAHIVQTDSLKKQYLIRNDEVNKFYTKYESQMIKFNNSDEEEKIKIAKEFYKTLREDFDFTDTDIDNYKLSVIPIIKAVDQVCSKLNENFTLNKQEMKYFDEELLNNRLKMIINCVDSNTKKYEKEDKITFGDMMVKEIATAKANNIYEINDEDRDISDHEDYKKNINIFNRDKTKTEKIEDLIIENMGNEDNSTKIKIYKA